MSGTPPHFNASTWECKNYCCDCTIPFIPQIYNCHLLHIFAYMLASLTEKLFNEIYLSIFLCTSYQLNF